MNEMKNEIYSYHTFLFPFIWEVGDVTVDEISQIREYFSANKYWKTSEDISAENKSLTKKEWIEKYANYQYFHPAFRKAVFDDENTMITCYDFDPSLIKNGAEYIIEKEECTDGGSLKERYLVQRKYVLTIRGISIKVFNTGVAVFTMECVNTLYRNLEDIKKINDFGRRVSIPFIPDRENAGDAQYYWTQSICADALTIRIKSGDDWENPIIAKEDFKSRILKINDETKFDPDDIPEQCKHVCGCISELILAGNEQKLPFTSATYDEKTKIDILPALDERMYVMSLIDKGKVQSPTEGKNFIKTLFDSNSFEDRDFIERLNEKERKSLYEYAYVDASDCSCQSQKMREELLQECIYDRWGGYGTIYLITAQAFQCITDFSVTIKSFLTQYLELCTIVLAQRASLINFQEVALKLSDGLEQCGKGINRKKISKLMDLQERFIAFQNQINFQEVSSQEQAVELYGYLRKANFVDPLNQAITEQLDALYDATNTNQDFSFNKWACILALIALGIDIPTFLFRADGSMFPLEMTPDLTFMWSWDMAARIVILVITIALVCIVAVKFRRKAKTKRRKK